MTEKELRQSVVDQAVSWLGATGGDAVHKEIIDTYNSQDPLPVGYRVTYTDDWCATFVSACAVVLGLTSIILPECSCTRMIALYEAVNRWEESDSYVPDVGDILMYEWSDTGVGDLTGDADHVGIVVSCDGTNIRVIEGNRNNMCQYRDMTVNGQFIRGYCLPDYASKAEAEQLTYTSGNRFLTEVEMKQNARFIWNYLGARGWTLNAVAGMLGNMETESTINPGIWQNLDEGDTDSGYGLVQWTPASKYIEWCQSKGLIYSSMDAALKRIEYELEAGLQYYPTDSYPETFSQFKVSTKSADYLAMAFLANYERPADPDQPARGTQALKWYNYLKDYEPGQGIPDDNDYPEAVLKPRRRLSMWLIASATRRR